MQTQNSTFEDSCTVDIPVLCVPLILALAITFVTQPPKVGINNTALDGKARVSVRFVASTKPTPGPGVKSNLSWTLSLFSFCSGSFPWAEFWVRSQEEWFEFRSHTQTVSHNNVFQSCCITGAKGNRIQESFIYLFFFSFFFTSKHELFNHHFPFSASQKHLRFQSSQ